MDIAVALRLCFYRKLEGHDVLRQYFHLLDAAERHRFHRLVNQDDRLRYLVSRALVRTSLSKLGNRSPSEWRFSSGALGKPELEAPNIMPSGFDFNLSHASGLILLGLNLDGKIGVDVESFDRALPSHTSQVRMMGLHRHPRPPPLSSQVFIRSWTLKEAFVKAYGLGIFSAVDSVYFDMSTGRIVSSGGNHIGRRHFKQFDLNEGFSVAVCTDNPVPLSCFEAVEVFPLVNEKPYFLPVALES